jgi:UDP-N-acetylmuramate--alanine ligase
MYLSTFKLHFVGIGGVGMRGLAEILLRDGATISGSDIVPNNLETLQSLGATISIGHRESNVHAGMHGVVYSSAILPDNVELIAARALGIPVLMRAEVLAEVMRFKHGIAVSGSHGKTSTTSFIGAVLQEANLDPTVIVGGVVKALSGGVAKRGNGDFLVAEADESDGSFLFLKPSIAVVTNIDAEHLESYKSSVTELARAFGTFLLSVPFYGKAIFCSDYPALNGLADSLSKKFITYGEDEGNDPDILLKSVALTKSGVTFQVKFGAKLRVSTTDLLALDEFEETIFTLPILGRHFALNALPAIAISLLLKIPASTTKKAFGNFRGIGRRVEVLHEGNGITIISDYGHHPTEIVATLTSIKSGLAESLRRLIVVFQPHRYSRTKACFSEFCMSFEAADKVLILPIFGAGESAIPGISGEALVKGVSLEGNSKKEVSYIPTFLELHKELLGELESGDVLLFLGAGSIGSEAKRFVSLYQESP